MLDEGRELGPLEEGFGASRVSAQGRSRGGVRGGPKRSLRKEKLGQIKV